MSDLISRKQISNYIKAQINPYGKPFEGTTYELGLKIMEYIDNMNSTYDVDKVFEQLEHLLKNFGEHCEDWGGECNYKSCSDCVLSHAIEIVKGGGVNEIKN